MKLDTRWMFFLIAVAAAAPSGAQPKITAVVNSATFVSGLPRGGALATVFCSGLQDFFPPSIYVAPQTKPLPTVLDGFVSVEVNGFFAPILAVVVGTDGTGQINFQVPPGRDAITSSLTGSGVLVACHDQYSYFSFGNWGGFFPDANGYAIAQHASNYSLVTTLNPAHAGEGSSSMRTTSSPCGHPLPSPLQPLLSLCSLPPSLPEACTSNTILAKPSFAHPPQSRSRLRGWRQDRSAWSRSISSCRQTSSLVTGRCFTANQPTSSSVPTAHTSSFR